jgi:hypothetical protein
MSLGAAETTLYTGARDAVVLELYPAIGDVGEQQPLAHLPSEPAGKPNA